MTSRSYLVRVALWPSLVAPNIPLFDDDMWDVVTGYRDSAWREVF